MDVVERGDGVALAPLSWDAEESVMPPSFTMLQRFLLVGGIAGDPDLLAAVMSAAAMLPGTSADGAGVCTTSGLGGLAYQPPRPRPHPLADIACCGALPTGAAALA